MANSFIRNSNDSIIYSEYVLRSSKNERALLNDICAIIVFCIGGLISYYFSMNQIDRTAIFIALISFLYFLGSTFYVKTMIREKIIRSIVLYLGDIISY